MPPFTVQVAALTSDTLGNLVFLSNERRCATAMGASANEFAGGLFDTASVQFAPGADPAKVAAAVQAEPTVVVYVPVAANLNTVDQARPIFTAVIQALLAIARGRHRARPRQRGRAAHPHAGAASAAGG